MTIDETLRATLHVLAAMQMEVLFVLQSGTMSGVDAQRLLDQLHSIHGEVRALRNAAAVSPEKYAKFAAPGQSANKPSEN